MSDAEAPIINSVDITDVVVTIGGDGFDLGNLPISVGMTDNLSGINYFTIYYKNP
jgi:hypothetical protein